MIPLFDPGESDLSASHRRAQPPKSRITLKPLAAPECDSSDDAANSRALSATFLKEWRYRAESARDLRLDWMRGFAVFVMVVDHLGSASWVYVITGGNTFLTS